jgi:fibro-slime domain-containing protein
MATFPPQGTRLAGLVLASLLFSLVATGCGSGRCGDGERQDAEACDDGNTSAGDGCSASCDAVEDGWACERPGEACVLLSTCGDGVVEGIERCDDSNTAAGDGCGDRCAVESGWSCPAAGGRCQAAACGDGLAVGDEECEDGNAVSGDGCSALCRLESGYKCPGVGQPCQRIVCGDSVIEGTEQCDDGNNNLGDGCTPLCTQEPRCANGTCEARCGDGILLPNSTTEQCDDGNTRSNDGCSAACQLEAGFACTLIEQTPPARVSIPIVYRDFRGYDLPAGGGLPRGHIDFQNKNAGNETGIVAATLGADGKPVYAKENVSSANTHGKVAFDQWYRDTPDVNKTIAGTLDLVRQPSGGSYVFDDQTFFPLDTAGWVASNNEPLRPDNGDTVGEQVRQRNFHFTSEARYWFEYKGTEVLSFRGDDDVWVFINGRLALDLGGIHNPASGTITLSQQASALGLRAGGIYEAVVFQAERHTSGSSYRLTLTNFLTRRTQCVATCGNSIVEPDKGEQCDDGVNDGGYGECARGCVWAPRCGDRKVQEEFGEDCDDGNSTPRDGCSPTCTFEIG